MLSVVSPSAHTRASRAGDRYGTIYLQRQRWRQWSHVYRYKGGSSTPRVCSPTLVEIFDFYDTRCERSWTRESIRPLYQSPFLRPAPFLICARIVLFFSRVLLMLLLLPPLTSFSASLPPSFSRLDRGIKLRGWEARKMAIPKRYVCWLGSNCVHPLLSCFVSQKPSYSCPVFAPVLAKIFLFCIFSHRSAVTPPLARFVTLTEGTRNLAV